MKKHIQFLLIVILLLSSFFIQGQEISISSKDVLRRQKQALTEQRNFIAESACPQREDVLKEYQANFDRLIEVLDIVTLVFHTPITIEKDRIKEQGDKFVTYQSSNLTNIIVKRHSSKISMAGIVSDNSSIPVGARLLTETFTFKDKEIEVLYRIRKKQITLITLEAIYKDKTRIYIEFQNLPQGQARVYNTSEYGTEFENLQVLFSYEIGKLNFIKTTGYELYPEQYTEMITQNQGIIKYRYAIRCYDEKGNQITPTQKGKKLEIKPTTYLLWYKGTIGKYPIHLMLKRGFVKEEGDVEINDTIISNVQYAYDSQKKWINIENLWERQAGIFGFEGQDDSPEWHVEFYSEDFYNKALTGSWDNQNGKILPVKLTPMTKKFPTFTFKAAVENELAPSGEISNQSITALNIYQNNKKIQQISLEENKPNLEYFKIGYVDINYDGYLDLTIDNSFFLYNPTTKKFDIPKGEEGQWEYIPNLTELYSYNPYTKSFTAQHRRSFIEYRVINGKITPYESESYYPDEDGNMISAKQKYRNGKWVTVSEEIEKMEEDDEGEVMEEDIDIGSPINYALNVDLTVSDGTLLFTPTFYNKTGVDLKQKAKLFVEMKSVDKKIHRQFLFDEPLSGEKENTFDDSVILFDGKNYFLEHYNDALIPFFPLNLKNGKYTFQLIVEHPLFGRVISKSQSIELPLQLKKDTSIEQFVGSINNKVNGSIYFKVNDKKVIGAFINAKTGKSIHLKGSYTSGFFGVDTLNLEEYEKEDELSGYFEGTISKLKGDNEGIYKGYWISPNEEIRVPFTFKKQ